MSPQHFRANAQMLKFLQSSNTTSPIVLGIANTSDIPQLYGSHTRVPQHLGHIWCTHFIALLYSQKLSIAMFGTRSWIRVSWASGGVESAHNWLSLHDLLSYWTHYWFTCYNIAHITDSLVIILHTSLIHLLSYSTHYWFTCYHIAHITASLVITLHTLLIHMLSYCTQYWFTCYHIAHITDSLVIILHTSLIHMLSYCTHHWFTCSHNAHITDSHVIIFHT